jgi:hypothetical protein
MGGIVNSSSAAAVSLHFFISLAYGCKLCVHIYEGQRAPEKQPFSQQNEKVRSRIKRPTI